ncbi:MAG: hypothetical protein AAF963_01380 [Bacteroidota bacterium]
MSKPQLSQTTLYEILTKKVQSLINTEKEFKKVCEQIDEQLQRVEALHQEPIPIDVEDLQLLHQDMSRTISRGLYVPQWLVRSIVAILLALSLSLFFNYRQDKKIRKQQYHIEAMEKKLKGKKRK